MKRKKPRPLGEVAAKPTERENRPLTRYRGSSPSGRALRYVQLYGCGFFVISDMLYCEKVTLIGRGTCGAAWNSLFVLRKLSSSHHDVIMPRKKLHCGADRVVVPSGSRQYLAVCRRDFPMQGDVAPKV